MKKYIGIAATALSLITVISIYMWDVHTGLIIEKGLRVREKWAGLETKEVKAAGHRWSYLDNGRKGSEVILLLHGFSSNKESWLSIAPTLCKNYRVIIPDIPGFGKTPFVPGKEYYMKDQAQRVSLFLKKLSVSKVHVMGTSMGGWIAMRLALDYADQVKSGALFASAGLKPAVESDYIKALRNKERNILIPDTLQGVESMMQWIFYSPPLIPQQALKWVRDKRIKRIGIERKLFSYLVSSNTDYTEKNLPSTSIPFLVIHGKNDRIIHYSSAIRLEKLIPRNTTVILEKTGHSALVERSGLVLYYTTKFLKEDSMAADVIKTR
jgi:abhydrolase domain-containing protein 6